MQVYVEYVIIENLIINAVLLSSTGLVIRRRRSYLRIIASACFGTAFSVLFPFVGLNGVPLYLCKIICGGVMVLIAFGFPSLKVFSLAFFFLAVFTYVTGGAIVFLCNVFGGDYVITGGGLQYSGNTVIPYGSIIGVTFFTCELVTRKIVKLLKKRDLEGFYKEVMIIDGPNATPVLSGFVDTGNKLYDDKSGAPVAVISSSVADKLIMEGILSLNGARYQKYATVSGESKMLIFYVSKMVIYSGDNRNIIDNATLGVGGNIAGGIDVLIPAAFCSNKLYDDKSGAPVAVISSSVADKLIMEGILSLNGARYQKYATVSGESKMLIFYVSKMVIYSGDNRNIIDNATLGVGGNIAGGIDVLIPAAFCRVNL